MNPRSTNLAADALTTAQLRWTPSRSPKQDLFPKDQSQKLQDFFKHFSKNLKIV